MPEAPLLQAEHISKRFPAARTGWFGRRRSLAAIDDVSFELNRAETLAVVGESGCGKSTVGRIAIALATPSAGRVLYAGEDLVRADGARWRALRREMQIVFQDSRGALDPRLDIETQVLEGLEIHGIGDAAERRQRARATLAAVELDGMATRFPHELSGGQQQRAVIARALAVEPKLIVCDEPVAALDVSIGAQIVNLLKDLQTERGLAYLFISHDLSLVRHVADRIAVMYLGRFVEVGAKRDVFERPLHPYTRALIDAVPAARSRASADRRRGRDRLKPGEPPSPLDPPTGCSLHPRCPHAEDRCRRETPPLRAVGRGQVVACHFVERWA